MTTKQPTKKAPAKKAGANLSLPILLTPAAYESAAASQKALAREVAQGIADGKPLDLDQDGRDFIALILRQWADNLASKPKTKQGSPPRFDHASEALVYAKNRWKGIPHGEALAEISERVGVSEQAVEKAIRKHRAAAFAAIGIPDPGNQ